MASSDEPPVVTTSSTITTSSPGLTGPSMYCSRAVTLGLLAHQNALERQPAHAGHRDDRGGDRIGADRHAADGHGQRLAEQIQNAFGDQLGPLRSRA